MTRWNENRKDYGVELLRAFILYDRPYRFSLSCNVIPFLMNIYTITLSRFAFLSRIRSSIKDDILIHAGQISTDYIKFLRKIILGPWNRLQE